MNLHLNITQDVWNGITIIFICYVIMIAAVLIDLYTGISAAKRTGEPIRSHILRKTIRKTIDYGMVIAIGILIDVLALPLSWYHIPYASMLITFSVVLIEGHSVLENLTRAKSPAAKVDDVVCDILPEALQEIIDAKTAKTATKVYEKLTKGDDNEDSN